MKLSKTIRFLSLLLGSIAVFLLSTNANAQTAKISGTVINQRTSAPLVGATVSVKNTNRTTVTDEAGRFSIEAAPGNVLVITSVGFDSQEIRVGSGDARVQLKEAENTMENVVVIGWCSKEKISNRCQPAGEG
jgi:uncharacterized membrane protein